MTDHWAKAVEAAAEVYMEETKIYVAPRDFHGPLRAALPHLVEAVLWKAWPVQYTVLCPPGTDTYYDKVRRAAKELASE